MRRNRCGAIATEATKGFTLAEVLIAIAVMSALFVALAGLVHACLRAETVQTGKSSLYSDGMLAMERMTSGLKACTFLHIPNNHNNIRDILAFSGIVNDDGDSQFSDTLFPRIDEDLGSDMSNDAFPGLASYDDDGDGSVDETGGLAWSDAILDDDEDGGFDEDWLDGVDNDGDGNIDEDLPADANSDLMPGVDNYDDDGDGSVDEGGGGSAQNDDEDDSTNEDAANSVVYSYNSGTNTLWEIFPDTGSSGILCNNVTAFSAVYSGPDCSQDPVISILLTLTDADGESITLTEVVYPRNIVQKWGKRVR
jgi:prepilin-type N-terminal cleavage/methylation domain-containing protein